MKNLRFLIILAMVIMMAGCSKDKDNPEPEPPPPPPPKEVEVKVKLNIDYTSMVALNQVRFYLCRPENSPWEIMYHKKLSFTDAQPSSVTGSHKFQGTEAAALIGQSMFIRMEVDHRAGSYIGSRSYFWPLTIKEGLQEFTFDIQVPAPTGS